MLLFSSDFIESLPPLQACTEGFYFPAILSRHCNAHPASALSRRHSVMHWLWINQSFTVTVTHMALSSSHPSTQSHCTVPPPVTLCSSDTWHFNNYLFSRHFLFSPHCHSWVTRGEPNTIHYNTHQLTFSYTVTQWFCNALVLHLLCHAGSMPHTEYALATQLTEAHGSVTLPHSHIALSLWWSLAVWASRRRVQTQTTMHMHKPGYSFIHRHAGILSYFSCWINYQLSRISFPHSEVS